MWIARDEDGIICIYDTKPVKDKHEWVIPNSTGGYSVIDSEMDGLADIKWEDEPVEVIDCPVEQDHK